MAHIRRLEATRNFVVGLSRHVCGAEAENDAHARSSISGSTGRHYRYPGAEAASRAKARDGWNESAGLFSYPRLESDPLVAPATRSSSSRRSAFSLSADPSIVPPAGPTRNGGSLSPSTQGVAHDLSIPSSRATCGSRSGSEISQPTTLRMPLSRASPIAVGPSLRPLPLSSSAHPEATRPASRTPRGAGPGSWSCPPRAGASRQQTRG